MPSPDPAPGPVPDPVPGPAPEPASPGSPARRLPPVEHRFKKGQSGNPGGRPKGSGVTAALRRLLEQAHNGKPLGELVAERWLKDVLNGKHAQLQMLLDRTEGTSITAALRAALQREHSGRTIAELVAERLIKEALSGKFPFAKEVLERAEGKVSDKTDLRVKRLPWREMMATLTDEDLIEMAAAQGRLDLLPPALRERAKQQLDQGALELGERREP